MPLDSHALLTAQGWKGSGSGLNPNSISKPLAIPKKRSLAGVGKDRDEAFPFWDHLFSAAAKSINIKLKHDDVQSHSIDASESCSPSPSAIAKTSTGLVSSLRPIEGHSSSEPSKIYHLERSSVSSTSSLIAIAKQQAARQRLYSMFHRGPVLAPEIEDTRRLELVPENCSVQLDCSDTSQNPGPYPVLDSQSVTKRHGPRGHTEKESKKDIVVSTTDDVRTSKRRKKLIATDSVLGGHATTEAEDDTPQQHDAKRQDRRKVEKRAKKRSKLYH